MMETFETHTQCASNSVVCLIKSKVKRSKESQETTLSVCFTEVSVLWWCLLRLHFLQQGPEKSAPTILDKIPWDNTTIFIFFCHFSVPS